MSSGAYYCRSCRCSNSDIFAWNSDRPSLRIKGLFESCLDGGPSLLCRLWDSDRSVSCLLEGESGSADCFVLCRCRCRLLPVGLCVCDSFGVDVSKHLRADRGDVLLLETNKLIVAWDVLPLLHGRFCGGMPSVYELQSDSKLRRMLCSVFGTF